MTTVFTRIGVAGAGAMGRGIAQLFAQAGIPIVIFDNQPGAADAAIRQIGETFAMLADKGRLTPEQAAAARGRLAAAASVAEFAGCDLVIEAIVERLDVKRALVSQLEDVLAPDAVIASNTSSLSITALAAGTRQPGRIAGYHFFNPVPLMKVVEVVRAQRTHPQVIERLCDLTRLTGHAAVVAADTPGFIVNHAGRGYGTEALRVVSEGVADFPTIDRIMREQVAFDGAGFRLGPFELLDLTGLDVSHPVMESIFRQFYDEPRFRPSVVAAQRLAAGLLGRKSGEGFYRYRDGESGLAEEAPTAHPTPAVPPLVWVAPGPRQKAVGELLAALGARIDSGPGPAADALVVVTPVGVDATTASQGLDAERVVALDTLFPYGARACKRRVIMPTPATDAGWLDQARALFAADGAQVSVIRDSAGFVAPRIVAMIVSIACEIAQQRIAAPEDIDRAVRIGLGYPVGPLTMGDRLGAATVCEVLAGMHAVSGDPRDRPSLWLQRRARLGLSLLKAD